jgi:hypothetical protein
MFGKVKSCPNQILKEVTDVHEIFWTPTALTHVKLVWGAAVAKLATDYWK